ncbi:MAG: zinc ABC transporter substrate-binding protein [Cohaesibacter sp.]|jgi:zinc transport system substrate-binding protein|nr:zinc ABC transporter substrate-binding protein [Cohaesibacter sp.]
MMTLKASSTGLKKLASKIALPALLLSAIAGTSAASAAPKVVTTIAPVHSITQAILGDVSKAEMLVPQNASPHSTDFRPSQAKALQQADLVVWVGPGIETFLIDPLKTLASKAHVLELMDAKGIKRLTVRTGGDWEKHKHDDHDDHKDHDHDKEAKHDDHDDHKDHDHDKEAKHDDHDDHKDHDHDKEAKHDDHDDHKDHDHDKAGTDNHIWLDPQNGIAMAEAIAAELSEIDPDNAKIYEQNKNALVEKLAALIKDGKKDLAPLSKRPFLVFHDAYQYLEARFDLSATGSIMLQPGVAPGAARVKEVRKKLTDLKAVCLFTEPQFSDKIVPVLLENTPAKLGSLDPIGATQKAGADLYLNLIRSNIKALKECLSAS